MRPPQNAGEDGRAGQAGRGDRDASMRPPQNAGEDDADRRCAATTAPCFNEAPAERGGRRRRRAASRTGSRRGFNEAPAERGGRRAPSIPS